MSPARTRTRIQPVTPVRFLDVNDRTRAGAAKAASFDEPTSEGLDFVASLDDDYLTCRYDRHDFPILDMRKLRSGSLPRGVKTKRRRDGQQQFVLRCRNCSAVVYRTLAGKRISRYDYTDAPGYLAPKNAGLRKADYIGQAEGRLEEAGLL